LDEKYRPKSFDEVIGQDEIVASIKSNIARDSHPQYLFVGQSGVGKTTMAHLLAQGVFGGTLRNRYNGRFVEFNASDARKIEDVRTKYKKLAMIQGRRIIYLSEFDMVTVPAQNALRRPIETTKNAIFIFSANYPENIIDALHSRCSEYRFIPMPDKVVIKRLLYICKQEGIGVNVGDENVRQGFYTLAAYARGDLRKAINTLEQVITEGKEITPESIAMLKKPRLATDALKRALAGDFQGAKEMIQDVFIMQGFTSTEVAMELYKSIPVAAADNRQVRVRLYEKLGQILRGCRPGAPSVIMFVEFMAFAWKAPRMMKCPALEGS